MASHACYRRNLRSVNFATSYPTCHPYNWSPLIRPNSTGYSTESIRSVPPHLNRKTIPRGSPPRRESATAAVVLDFSFLKTEFANRRTIFSWNHTKKNQILSFSSGSNSTYSYLFWLWPLEIFPNTARVYAQTEHFLRLHVARWCMAFWNWELRVVALSRWVPGIVIEHRILSESVDVLLSVERCERCCTWVRYLPILFLSISSASFSWSFCNVKKKS